MGNVFEFKLQLPGSNLVDKISTSEMAKDFSELVDKFKQEFADVKEKVENSKVYKEAKNAVKKFPLLYADPAKLTLTVGETSFQAKDDKEFAKYEKMLNQTLGDANEELANSEHLKTLEEEEALKKARKESETVKDDVTETTKKADKDVEKSEGETYETFSKSSQLEARYKAAQAAPSDDAEFNMTREEERLQRLTEKLQASTSEAQRERISKRIDKLSRKIAHRRARTTDHMANAADNYVRGEKMEHQMWYYNDIINALTKDKKSNRVHYFDDYILIDTYHPLFKNKDNSNGTIKLTGESVDAYMEHTPDGKRYTAEMQKYYNVHPEDRNQIENKGGMLGLLSNKMVEYTNMSPKSAAAMKSVAKIGLIIGGGILAWKTIKHIFNIGGVNKDDKYAGWKRGLGAAAVLFGVPMLTGQSIDQLLISGDAKKAWKDMKKLLHLEGVSDFISDNFADLNNRVIYGGLGNIMYEDVSAEQMRKFTVFDEETEKTTLKTKEFKTYRQKQLKDAVDADDAGTAQKIQQKIELLDEAIKTHQEHEITHSYRKSTHYDTVENKSKLCGELYKDFLNAQEAAGKLLADNQNLKIEDQAELDRYIADQIMNKGKKPSEIKLKDLIGHGVIVVVTASPDAAPDATKKDKADDDKADKKEGKKEQKDEEKKDKKEKKDEIQPEAKKENADPLVDREKVETWTKDKWEKFRDGVKSVSITVAEFSASVFTGEIFHRNDSEKLKQARGTLKFAKELLKDLTKRKELQEKTNITEAEIHTVEIEIEELELQAIQMAEMMQDAIDPVLTSMEWLTDEQKKELSRGIRKLNFELKFKSANDIVKFKVEKNELFVESAGDKTLIRYEDGNYYMDKYMVPFKDAESVIRLANLTNFAKVNFANRATTNVEKAWFIANDGDLTFDPKTTWDAFRKGDVRGMLSNITILDGEDGYKSAIKKLGWDVLESQKAQYADYLNALQDANGKNLWVLKADKGLTKKELSTMETAFTKPLDLIKSGNLWKIDRPPTYEGKEVINDPKATLTTEVGYLTLKSHGKSIQIRPGLKNPQKYAIWYVNADEKDGSLGGDCLDIDFATPEEAIKVANLVNFYKAVYSGYGSKWSKAFNISSVQDGLEFAKNGFGPSKWFDLNALGNKTAVDIYSPELNAQGLEIFKDWLNSLQDR